MKMVKKLSTKIFTVFLASAIIVAGSISTNPQSKLSIGNVLEASAESETITSMDYYSTGNGPILTGSGVGSATYGFVMPVFNGGDATWADVASDLSVKVKVDGNWVGISDVSTFEYNTNWGNWSDGGFNGYWFEVTETTYLQLASKTNDVSLEYTLEFTNIDTTTITSMTATQGPSITAGVTGGCGFTYPTFNNDTTLIYDAVADDLKVYVKSVDSSEWIDIDNNASSGWVYDSNFGQFTDGGGGYWFTVDESINVRLVSISSPDVYLDYTITYEAPERTSYTLTAYDGTSYTADDDGAIGIPLPKIDGGAAYESELANFVYELKVDGEWVELADNSKSGFSYSGSGYNNTSASNQWGYWADGIYGLWFQPIQVDMDFRIGYPLDGTLGGDVGNNYVTYTFVGNPDAPRPDETEYADIVIPETEDTVLDGWNLVLNDEFNGTSLDTSLWNYSTGYYINDDPDTWGWGNNEMEYYTDSEKNVFVDSGNLNIVAYDEPTAFAQDPDRYAQYSSGKITKQDNFSFTYGRIDFRAKLPTGDGLWPALWLLPNDNTYGTWAASGEIDVMEARGRLPETTSGTIHFGGTWPANTYLGSDYSFSDGNSIDSDFHVYSVVWEEDNIKWYVDGECFFVATNDQWYSDGDSDNANAPFDQQFYIIMNLAVGGWFDNELTPDASDIPATMQVDYVRVYKAEGSVSPEIIPVEGVTMDQTSVTLTEIGQTTTLTKTFTPSNATNKNITWVSSNPEVATASAGQITAVSDGTTTITATTNDGGFTTSCLVTVSTDSSDISVTGVSLYKTTDELTAYGETTTLTATVAPTNATNQEVTFTSSYETVATVSSTGIVTALANGTTTITATSVDGLYTDSCLVTVNIPTSGQSNDDVTFALDITNDWGSGFTGTFTITNNTDTAITNWQLAFDWDKSITSLYTSNLVSHSDDSYVISGLSWNNTINPGDSLELGFQGSTGNVTTSPQNVKLTADDFSVTLS